MISSTLKQLLHPKSGFRESKKIAPALPALHMLSSVESSGYHWLNKIFKNCPIFPISLTIPHLRLAGLLQTLHFSLSFNSIVTQLVDKGRTNIDYSSAHGQACIVEITCISLQVIYTIHACSCFSLTLNESEPAKPKYETANDKKMEWVVAQGHSCDLSCYLVGPWPPWAGLHWVQYRCLILNLVWLHSWAI